MNSFHSYDETKGIRRGIILLKYLNSTEDFIVEFIITVFEAKK